MFDSPLALPSVPVVAWSSEDWVCLARGPWSSDPGDCLGLSLLRETVTPQHDIQITSVAGVELEAGLLLSCGGLVHLGSHHQTSPQLLVLFLRVVLADTTVGLSEIPRYGTTSVMKEGVR